MSRTDFKEPKFVESIRKTFISTGCYHDGNGEFVTFKYDQKHGDMPVAPVGTDLEYLDDANYWKAGGADDPEVMRQAAAAKKIQRAMKKARIAAGTSNSTTTAPASRQRTSGRASKQDRWNLLVLLEQAELQEHMERLEDMYESALSFFDATNNLDSTSAEVRSDHVAPTTSNVLVQLEQAELQEHVERHEHIYSSSSSFFNVTTTNVADNC